MPAVGNNSKKWRARTINVTSNLSTISPIKPKRSSPPPKPRPIPNPGEEPPNRVPHLRDGFIVAKVGEAPPPPVPHPQLTTEPGTKYPPPTPLLFSAPSAHLCAPRV